MIRYLKRLENMFRFYMPGILFAARTRFYSSYAPAKVVLAWKHYRFEWHKNANKLKLRRSQLTLIADNIFS